MSKPNDNELEELVWGLNPYLESDDGSDRASRHLENTKAKAALNAYFLSQALEIIGEDDEEFYGDAQDRIGKWRNQLRAELRKAFKSKYAPKEGQ